MANDELDLINQFSSFCRGNPDDELILQFLELNSYLESHDIGNQAEIEAITKEALYYDILPSTAIKLRKCFGKNN